MSHSKISKRGRSLYIEKWNPTAKKYINTCLICGDRGYAPSVAQAGFMQSAEHRAIYAELTKAMKPLALDALGRCETCASVMKE